MATHSSVLAWTIPGMEEPGGLPMGLHRVGHDWSDLAAAAAAANTWKLNNKFQNKFCFERETQDKLENILNWLKMKTQDKRCIR